MISASARHQQERQEDKQGGGRVKIFISWSGDRSHQLAQALHGWLPLVLPYVEPWLSQANKADDGQR
jgi:hypothetical protein